MKHVTKPRNTKYFKNQTSKCHIPKGRRKLVILATYKGDTDSVCNKAKKTGFFLGAQNITILAIIIIIIINKFIIILNFNYYYILLL